MFVLGVTGPIGAGKTTVVGLLAELGADTITADLVSREIMGPGSPLVRRIGEAFGARLLGPDGDLDRRALGRHVFASRSELDRLNALVHPSLRAEIVRRIGALRGRSRPPELVTIEAAVMAEMAAFDLLDALLYVDADEELRVSRLVARDGLTREEATSRIRAQEGIGALAKKARWVVDGAQPVEALRADVLKIREEIAGAAPS
jgi:dephospho-CoA kinase